MPTDQAAIHIGDVSGAAVQVKKRSLLPSAIDTPAVGGQMIAVDMRIAARFPI
jgi:hypothetical protein